MTEVKTMPSTLLEEKSTYLKINKKKVEDLERLIDLLNLRKELIAKEDALISAFDKNERAILLLKTEYELAKHHKTRLGLIEEMKKYVTNASEIVSEMEQKWDEVVARAKKDATRKQDLAQIVKSMDDVDFNENIDVKLNYYLQLKGMVYNTGKPKLAKA